ncbi:Trypanosome variant surface glycoprotein C-terminal domain containing protein, putative [Trypanosoma equiperdum]|uniref:Trypanosome variant surface glycoprotein C-terminal domain containing protein, putative n=1 Tax=Trypanosoma equiperdum TaxID=5694 RepID=A0A1G4IHK7_TRYEQ|nr:Trypanosome variant surface glycoprotein C-terminal domain containing protein, putative [Trypanosoma equiperdum]
MKDTTYHALNWLCAACAISLTVTANVNDNSGSDQIPSTCGGMQLLDNRLEGARQALRSATANLEKNIHTANLWLHESVRHRGKQAAAFAILVAYAGTTNAADTQAIKNKQAELDKVGDIINRRIGTTAAMDTVAKANFDGPITVISSATDTTGGGGPKAADVQLKPVALAPATCKTPRDGSVDVKGQRTKETLSRKIALSQQAKYAALQTAKKPKLTCSRSDGTSGTVAWHSNGNVRGCSVDTDQAVISLDLSAYKLLDDPKPELVALKTGDNNDQCHPTADKDKETMPADNDVLGAICELDKIKTIAVKDLEQTTLSELQQSPEVQGALAMLYGKDSIGSSKLEKTVKLLFETTNENFKKDYITTPGDKQTAYHTTTEQSNKQAKELAEGPGLASALASLHKSQLLNPKEQVKSGDGTDKAVESAESQPENKKDNTDKPVCSTLLNQTACEGVTGTPPTGKAKVCGWIEGKCQDSSILANKQFALSVVSAFVSLVKF